MTPGQREEIHNSDSVIMLDPFVNIKELKDLEDFISSQKGKSLFSDSVINIPIVFHVIHKGESYGLSSNITDEQILSSVTSINDHFSNFSGDGPDAVNTNISFCLANRDPEGNFSTGINRVSGCSVTDYCSEGITAGLGSGANELNVKNLSRWPSDQYYNVWIVSEIENNNGGGGIQGYAYFPTSSPTDGTVILYNAIGTTGNLKSYTNQNKTLSHELGHGFGLFHTFQGGSCSEGNCNIQGDRVCDTPPTDLNTSCFSPSCVGAQTENYMDYTSQSCKNTFTQGQTERMRLSILNSRPDLANNVNVSCLPSETSISYRFDLPRVVCDLNRDLDLYIKNDGVESLYSCALVYGSHVDTVYSFDWSGFLASGDSLVVVLPGQSTLRTTVGVKSISVNGINGEGPIITDNSRLGSHKLRFETTPDILGGQNGIRVFDINLDEEIFSRDAFPNFAQSQTFIDSTCVQPTPLRITFYDVLGNGFYNYSSTDDPRFRAIWTTSPSGDSTLIDVSGDQFDCDSVYFLSASWDFIGCPEESFEPFILYFDQNGNEISEDKALKEKTYFRHSYFENQKVKRQKIVR
jgi:hypothetical protein